MSYQVQYFEYDLYSSETLYITIPGRYILIYKENHDKFTTRLNKANGYESSNTVYYKRVGSGETLEITPVYSSPPTLKFGIIRETSTNVCSIYWWSFVPTTFRFTSFTDSSSNAYLTSTSNICFAVLSNNQFKYDITYSTQYAHNLNVNGPIYNNLFAQLWTSSTSSTSTKNYTSNNLLFHLISDSVSSSRLIDVKISNVYIPTATRSISASPTRSFPPSQSDLPGQTYHYYETTSSQKPPLENNSTSNTTGIILFIGGGFILVIIIAGIMFFIINQQKKEESTSSMNDIEKKNKHKKKAKNENTPQNYAPQNGQTSQQYPPYNYPDPKTQQYNQQLPPNQYNQQLPPNQYNQQLPPNQYNQQLPPNQYNQQLPPFNNGLNNSISPNQQQPFNNPNNNEIKK